MSQVLIGAYFSSRAGAVGRVEGGWKWLDGERYARKVRGEDEAVED